MQLGLLRTMPRTDTQSSHASRLRPGPFPRIWIWASKTQGKTRGFDPIAGYVHWDYCTY